MAAITEAEHEPGPPSPPSVLPPSSPASESGEGDQSTAALARVPSGDTPTNPTEATASTDVTVVDNVEPTMVDQADLEIPPSAVTPSGEATSAPQNDKDQGAATITVSAKESGDDVAAAASVSNPSISGGPPSIAVRSPQAIAPPVPAPQIVSTQDVPVTTTGSSGTIGEMSEVCAVYPL